MERKTSRDLDPEDLHWFDQYVHGQIDRLRSLPDLSSNTRCAAERRGR
jgi:hypothetical protein